MALLPLLLEGHHGLCQELQSERSGLLQAALGLINYPAVGPPGGVSVTEPPMNDSVSWTHAGAELRIWFQDCGMN